MEMNQGANTQIAAENTRDGKGVGSPPSGRDAPPVVKVALYLDQAVTTRV